MRNKRGTTLIEMMVAITILTFVALAVIMALVSIQQAWLKQKSGIELFNNVRWAMESMVNEIRRARNSTVNTVGIDGICFSSPLVADTELVFYWRGDGGGYGNSGFIFRGVGANLSSANSSSSKKELVNLVANTNSVFSVAGNNLVSIELTVRKGTRFCTLKSKARPRN
ncbi:MAG: prepilin-type N-terminal cleavage/methylation domain-containing protein [Candidatus Omnitrophota bacterium]